MNPTFVFNGGDGVTQDGAPVPLREGIGLAFDCPCRCESRIYVLFENPTDGGLRLAGMHAYWRRTGDTFESMTLEPSILRRDGCGWHGYVRGGEILTC